MYNYSETKQISWSSSTFLIVCGGFLLGLGFFLNFFRFCTTVAHPLVWSLHCLNYVGNAVHLPLEIGMVEGCVVLGLLKLLLSILFWQLKIVCVWSGYKHQGLFTNVSCGSEKTEEMLSRVSNVCVNWQRGGGRRNHLLWVMGDDC